MNFEPGQKVWLVRNWGQRIGHEATVERVGRVWAYLSTGARIRIGTRAVLDSRGCSNETCWASESDHAAGQFKSRLLGAYRDAISRGVINSCSVVQLREAAQILGIELPEPPK